jgi:hypothetical protein
MSQFCHSRLCLILADQEKKMEDYLYDGLHHRGWRYAKQKEGSVTIEKSKIPSRLRMNILFAF